MTTRGLRRHNKRMVVPPRSRRFFGPALAAWAVALALLGPPAATAAPRHDICADLGPTLGFGVSSFGAAEAWPAESAVCCGVDWRFLYVYVVPTDASSEDLRWWLHHKAGLARELGALPVYSFYHLLHVGWRHEREGSDPEVVRQVLESSTLMREVFDRFVELLELVAAVEPPVLVHVEPDSWGFMMWAMGVEGNADATSVPVQVAGSGHPDLSEFPDHAGGLGRAFLRLRDRHAPQVRMGWHASNFRVGTRPDVVAGFYASMGEWDVLLTEHPHVEVADERWWEPLDPDAVETNLRWIETVTGRAGVPLLLWQMPIGTTDWHLLGNDAERTLLRRYLAAGVVGLLMDMRGEGDPDDYRAGEPTAPGLATPPPSGSEAGGAAADMKQRLGVYAADPIAWPAGSLCAPPSAEPTPDAGGAADGVGLPDVPAPMDRPLAPDRLTVDRLPPATVEPATQDAPSGGGCRGGASSPGAGNPLWLPVVLAGFVNGLRRRRPRRRVDG